MRGGSRFEAYAHNGRVSRLKLARSRSEEMRIDTAQLTASGGVHPGDCSAPG
jgi:hypothetical protein